jgi:hypothetical protein
MNVWQINAHVNSLNLTTLQNSSTVCKLISEKLCPKLKIVKTV